MNYPNRFTGKVAVVTGGAKVSDLPLHKDSLPKAEKS